MAKARTTSFSKFVVELGDNANPQGFVAPCGFVNKGFELTAQTSDVNVPDCDDPEAPAWVERGVTSLSAQVTGSGVAALESMATWRAWFMSGQAKTVRVNIDLPAADGGGYYEFPALLTTLSQTVQLGENGNKLQQSVTIQSSGQVAFTPAAA